MSENQLKYSSVETGVGNITTSAHQKDMKKIDEKSMTKEVSNASGRLSPVRGAIHKKEWDSKSPIAH